LGAPAESIHLSTSKDIARMLRAAASTTRTPSLLKIKSSPKGSAELSPGGSPKSANLFRMFFVKFPQNRHPESL
jgi:hypothetical protein